MIGRGVLLRLRAAATIRSMTSDQTVLVVTIHDDDPKRRKRIASRLRSVLHHPSAKGYVTYTEEDFPQAPPAPLADSER